MPVDFKTAVQQEEAYLRAVHPTSEDIPKCMTLFDDFLLCHGTLFASGRYCIVIDLRSHECASEVPLPVRQDDRMHAEAGGLQILHEQQRHASRREARRVDSKESGVVGQQAAHKE